MPSYKTHSIHSEIVLPDINNRVIIDREDLKKYAFGPDALLIDDYGLFEYQHRHNTRNYFFHLINKIKEKKMQDNSKTITFLYGQLDHFVLDLVMHPLIYYMTEGIKKEYKLAPHALIEMWIDDYVMLKNNKLEEKYYFNSVTMDKSTEDVINESYFKVFKKRNVASKYKNGIFLMTKFDKIRNVKNNFVRSINSRLKVGNIFYNRNINRVINYLNLEHEKITNPVTGELFNDSFDDLWNRSLMVASELIDDVNGYLYGSRLLTNYYISNDISYNTGLPCCDKEVFKYVKKYK